eukprot:scaffold67579_cov62-Phaeocystis_antarctica.AAC.2
MHTGTPAVAMAAALSSLAARPPLTSCAATLDEMPAAPGEPTGPWGNESPPLPRWSKAAESATLGRHQCATASSPRHHNGEPLGPRE